MSRLLLALSLAALSVAQAAAADPAKLDPSLPYQAQKSNPVTYDVEFAFVVTPPYHTKTLKVWVPIPPTDAGQEVSTPTFSTFPMTVKPQIGAEKVFGNQFAYFEFDHPEGAQIIRTAFKVKVWELRWNMDAAKVAKVADWPTAFQPYLQTEKQAVVVNDDVRKLAQLFVPKPQNTAQDFASVMAGVNSFMKYDHDAASLGASSEFAIKNQRGHCSDDHGLCSALGRALGYPTRMTYGVNPFPKNSPSHCKMEAFLPPYGWVSFDVSETQRLIADVKKSDKLDAKQKDALTDAANQRLNRGFRDNTWFVQTCGSDYDLAPPAAKRAPVVRTIYAEADGVALPEPDPANKEKREFSWMTAHKYTADKQAPYPFKDFKTLQEK